MKHALLLIVCALAAYVLWNVASPIERRHAARQVGRHAIRAGALVLAVVVLLALAYFIPAANIL